MRTVERYAIAVGVVVASLAIQHAIRPWFPPSPFLVAYPTVFLLARFLGCGPSLLATFLLIPAILLWFIEPLGSLQVANTRDVIDVTIFGTLSIMISLLVHWQHKAEVRAVKAIAELDQVRSQWNAVVAHDLLQPINSIMLRVQRLLRIGTLCESDAEAIMRSGTRLNRLVKDLLQSSQLELGTFQLNRQDIDLTEVIKDVVDCTQLEVPDRDIQLTGCFRAMVSGDPERLSQVVSNLLNNAIKYGGAGKPIEVHVSATDGMVQVATTSYGEVIPQREIPVIFDRFYRSEKSQRHGISGLGVGLFIVKCIVTQHGGTIWCESETGRTRFTFTIPLLSNRKDHHGEQL